MGRLTKNTTLANRGRFGRVCVEVELEKPLVGLIEIDGFSYIMEYKGLHTFSFKCGRYGHRKILCPQAVSLSNDSSGYRSGRGCLGW